MKDHKGNFAKFNQIPQFFNIKIRNYIDITFCISLSKQRLLNDKKG